MARVDYPRLINIQVYLTWQTKWIDEIECPWCEGKARVGIEKDGAGNTYRVMCSECGAMTQVGRPLSCRGEDQSDDD